MQGDFTGLRSQCLARLLQLPCALAPGPSSLARPAAWPLLHCHWPLSLGQASLAVWGRAAGQGGGRLGLQKSFEVLGGGGGAAEDPGLVRLLEPVGAGPEGTAAGTVRGVSLCSQRMLAAGGLRGPVVCIWRPVGPLFGSQCLCQLQGTGPRDHRSFSEGNQTPELGSD